jgi:hypothetical protein
MPLSAALPSTFIASCMHSTCNGRSPMLVPLLSPPHTPSASPASTTLLNPHVCRVLVCMTPHMCSTRSSHSPSPTPRLSPPCPPLPCPAPGYPLPQSQLMSGTGSTTCSIARARSKCNEHSPLPTPSSSPPWALHLSSMPTPATTRNLGLLHCEQDGYHLLCAAHTAAVPPFSHALPASSIHSQPYTALLVDGSARWLPITSTGCVCCGDSVTVKCLLGVYNSSTSLIKTQRAECELLD